MRRQYTRFFRPCFWRFHRRGIQTTISIFLGVCLAMLLIHHFDCTLRPHLVALAEARVKNEITHIANSAVSEVLSDEALGDARLITFQSTETEVATFTTDTARLNLLRAEILNRIVCQAESLDKDSVSIPVGALTGIDLFSALGPNLPLHVHSVASADGIYRNDFSSAGVNQTLHRIMLDITVTVNLLLPGGLVTTNVTTPVCVAETVIIGQPPQTYLNLNQ